MYSYSWSVGFDQARIDAWLREKVDSHSQFFKLLLRPDLPVQVAFLLLRQCLIPSMGYLARVVSPRALASHASSFDDTVIRTASEKLGLPPSIDTAALLPLSLPIRLGGFGLRSVRLVSPAAYWASLACSAPYILDFVPDKNQLLRGDIKAEILEDVKCHHALCSIARVPRDLVPSDPANFWVTYGHGAVSRGLQKALCVLIDERIAADYGTVRAHRGDKQRMTSCSARNAGAWLTAIPSSPAVTLMDTEFQYAARHRLGLPPQHNLPAACRWGGASR